MTLQRCLEALTDGVVREDVYTAVQNACGPALLAAQQAEHRCSCGAVYEGGFVDGLSIEYEVRSAKLWRYLCKRTMRPAVDAYALLALQCKL